MHPSGKRILAFVIIVSAILTLFAYMISGNGPAIPAGEAVTVKPPAPGAGNGNDTAHGLQRGASPDDRFTTKNEIREKYGRLEIVTLYDGRVFEGAVFSMDENYTMITVDGIVKIRMSDVRIRDILR